MNVNRWKRLLSVLLTLSMVLSWNVPSYAAAGDVDQSTCQHEFTVLYETVEAPTCTESGVGLYECGKCGYVDETMQSGLKKIDPLGHDYQTETVSGGCGEKDKIITTCSRCTYHNEVETGEVSPHNFPTDPAQMEQKEAATCEHGVIKAYKCQNEDCGAWDEEENWVEDKTTKLEHNYTGDWADVAPATCMKGKKQQKKCVNGCDAVNPNPTEEEAKTQVQYVGDPDEDAHDYEGQQVETIEQPNCAHGTVTGIRCKNGCDVIKDRQVGTDTTGTHDFEGQPNLTKAGDCMTAGYTYQVCKVCGEAENVITQGSKDPEKHVWKEAAEKVSEPNCQQGTGTAHFCSNPEHADVHDAVVYGTDKDETNHVNTEKIPAVAPNCKGEGGLTEGLKCSDCNTIIVQQQPTTEGTPAHDIDMENPTSILKPNTCANDGLAKYKCKVCGKTTYDVLPAAHDYEIAWDPSEPTCTAGAEKTMVCKRVALGTCDKQDGTESVTETVDALGHTWKTEPEATGGQASTCSVPGYDVYACEKCTETKQVALPLASHNPANAEYGIIEATCTSAKSVGWKCGDCGAALTEKDGAAVTPAVIPAATDDSFTAFLEEQDAAYLENNGVDDSDAGYAAFMEALAQGGSEQTAHTYVDMTEEELAEANLVNVAVTCTTNGTTYQKCSACGKQQAKTVTATGHTFSQTGDKINAVETPATCTEASIWKAYCTSCKQEITLSAKELEDNSLVSTPATSHDYQPMEDVAATCKADGSTGGEACTKCGDVKVQPTVVPAGSGENGGHDWQEQNPLTPSTCTDNGLGKFKCSICNKTKYETIVAKHTWGDITPITPAKCGVAGVGSATCTVCSTTSNEIEIPALEHHMIKDTVNSKPATCGEDGVEIMICDQPGNCTETTRKVLPATGEHVKTFQIVEATCGAPTKVGVACSNCNLVEEPIEITSAADLADDAKISALTAAYAAANGITLEEDGSLPADQQDAFDAFIADLSSKAAAATGNHTYEKVEEESVDQSCDEDAPEPVLVQLCSVCGDKKTTKLERLDHQWEDHYTPATCTTPGTNQEVCTECGKEEQVVEVEPALDHHWVKTRVLNEATCTANGMAEYTCDNMNGDEPCGETKFEVIDKSEGHKYNAGEVTTEVTCTTDGVKTYTCSVCDENTPGHTKTEVIEATGHAYSETPEIIDPTCTDNMKIGKQCSKCKEFEGEVQTVTDLNMLEILAELVNAGGDEEELAAKLANHNATGHSWEPQTEDGDYVGTPEVENATCTEDGSKTYKCTNANCPGGESSVHVEVIPATGHDTEEQIVAATCTEDGYIKVTCKNGCGMDEKVDLPTPDPAHHIDGAVTYTDKDGGSDMTKICENGGTKQITCTRCNVVRTETIEPGHDNETKQIRDEETNKLQAIIQECKRCHHQELIYLMAHAAYCQEHGVVAGTADTITKAGKAATCDETGLTEEITCLEEHTLADGTKGPKVVLEQTVIDKLEHKQAEDSENNWHVITEPTCSADGVKKAICGFCGKDFGPDVVIESTGEHTYVSTYVPANCSGPEQAGMLCTGCGQVKPGTTVTTGNPQDPDAHFIEDGKCKYCKKTIEELKELGFAECTNPATECGLVKPVQVPKQEGTCQEAGHEAGTKCPKCNFVLSGMEEIPGGHTIVDVEKKEATCTEAGHEAGKQCSVCKEITEGMQVIPAKGHTPVDVPAKAATCSEAGYTAGTQCSVCETKLSGMEPIAKLNHTVVNVPAKEATCTEAGYAEGTQCSVCKETLSGMEPIAMLGHDEVAVEAKAATCTEDGNTAGTQCSRCHEFMGGAEKIDKLGHHEVTVDKVEATCKEAGHEAGVICDRCNTTISGMEPIAKLAHTEVNVPAKAPTCTEDGNTAGKKCSVCQEILEGVEKIEATGHTVVTTPGKAATCTEDGLTDKKECSVCHEVLQEQTVIKAEGHKFENDTCSVCGAVRANANNTTGIVNTPAEGEDNEVTFDSKVQVEDKDSKIVEMGILYVTSKTFDYSVENVKNALKFDLNADGTYSIASPVRIKSFKASADLDLSVYTGAAVTITLGNDPANRERTLCGRGYVIVEKDGVYSVYFDDQVSIGSHANGFETK